MGEHRCSRGYYQERKAEANSRSNHPTRTWWYFKTFSQQVSPGSKLLFICYSMGHQSILGDPERTVVRVTRESCAGERLGTFSLTELLGLSWEGDAEKAGVWWGTGWNGCVQTCCRTLGSSPRCFSSRHRGGYGWMGLWKLKKKKVKLENKRNHRKKNVKVTKQERTVSSNRIGY